jgi:DNA repair protein RadC
MKILDMPEQNRPRERFLKQGPQALSDSELLAILLRTGTRGKKNEKGELMPGENVIDMSNRLISEYGLDKLLECSLVELQKIKGIGPSKAMQILTIAELQKRINQSKTPLKKITCAKDVYDYFNEELKDKKQENFYILMLDNKNKIINHESISKGILDSAIIHPREVFRPAIKNSSARIILVHNHPSGNPSPSAEDLEITKRLVDAGETVDIKVLDHVIVGENEWWSWGERKS